MSKWGVYVVIAVIFAAFALGATVDEQVFEELEENPTASVIIVLEEDELEFESSVGIAAASTSEEPPKISKDERKAQWKQRSKKVRREQRAVLRNIRQKKPGDVGIASGSYDFDLQEQFTVINGFSGEVTKEGIKKLQQDKKVKHIYIEQHYHIVPFEENIGPAYTTSIPAIDAINARSIYNVTGLNITVAVLDTGIDYTHDDLGNCSSIGGDCRIKDGYDFFNEDADPIDDHGHGTHVAGIIGANGSVVGVAPEVDFLAYKVCNSAGSSCPSSDIINGVDAAVGNGTDIISVSLGGEQTPNDGGSALSTSLSNAVLSGVVVVVAAGNNGPSTGCVSSPGDGVNVITVGNVDDQGTVAISDDEMSSTSCAGPSAFGRLDPDLSAPGTSITSLWLNDATNTISGTSMATPHVSGAAALMLEYNSSLSAQDVRARLMHTTSTIGAHTFSEGAGIINVSRAMEYKLTANVSGADRWEAVGDKGDLIQKTVTFSNTGPDDVSFTFTATNLTDMEESSFIDASQFTFSSSVVVASDSSQDITFNFTIPSDANTSIYGGVISATTNGSQTLRIPVTFSVFQSVTDTITGIVDKKRVGCSNSACGDKIIYYINTSTFNKTINLSWSSTSNNLDLSVYNDSGTLVTSSKSSTSESETVSVESTDNSIWLLVHALDLASDSSDLFFNLSVTLDTNPSIAFNLPANNTAHSTDLTMNVSTSDSNTLSTSSYNVTDSSGNLIQQNTNTTLSDLTFNWTDSLNLSNSTFSDGNYTLTVFVNNTFAFGTTSDITFTVDKGAPQVISINAPTNNSNFSTGFNLINASLNESVSTIDSVSFNITNASSSVVITASNGLGDSWNASYNFSRLEEGNHNITIVANDTAGNVNDTQYVTITVDLTDPVVNLESPANLSTADADTSVTFSYNVSDALLQVTNCSLLLNGSTNLTNTTITESSSQSFSQSFVEGMYAWTIQCSDEAGNTAAAGAFTLNVTERDPIVTLNSPVDMFNTSNSSVTFNCSATDDFDLDNITLYGNWSGTWAANETVDMAGVSNSTTFTKEIGSDGTYVWSCEAADVNGSTSFASSNYSFTLDTVAPVITSVADGSISSSGATITWTTDESANSSVAYGTTTALGSSTKSASFVTSHSLSLSSLSASTLYYYNVTSCDFSGNCNTSDPENFTTSEAESSSSSSSSSSSGAGGGSGGGASTTTTTTTSSTSEEDLQEESSEAGGSDDSSGGSGSAIVLDGQAEDDSSQTVSVSDTTVTVSFKRAGLPLTGLAISSDVEKEITIDVQSFDEKPEPIKPIENVYKYLEITADITQEEIDELTVTFTVPKEWLEMNNYSHRTVRLNTFNEETKEWQKLKTKLVGSENGEYTYDATLEHLSFFAITASEKKSFWSFLDGFSFSDISFANPKILIVVGIIGLIIILSIVYWIIQKMK